MSTDSVEVGLYFGYAPGTIGSHRCPGCEDDLCEVLEDEDD